MEKQIFIDGIETNYTVTDDGVVKNSKTGRIMTINNGNVQLYINGKGTGRSVGKIVAEAFLEKPNGDFLVNHKDGNKMNNRIDNLEWITNEENSKNVWNKRRENNTTNAGKKVIRKKRENIVEINTSFLTDNEKQIILDGKLIPYSVDKDGKVRTGKFLSGSVLHSYQYINFRWDGKQKNKAVHRLVAEAFLEKPDKKSLVDHIDGDRLNNKIENLRWVTAKENANNIHLERTPEKPKIQEYIFTKEDFSNEIWKEYLGYEISNLGRVKGRSGKILKGAKLDCGYISYTINNKSVLGHLLVWKKLPIRKIY